MLRTVHGSRQRLIERLGVGLVLMALFSGAALLSAPTRAARSVSLERPSL